MPKSSHKHPPTGSWLQLLNSLLSKTYRAHIDQPMLWVNRKFLVSLNNKNKLNKLCDQNKSYVCVFPIDFDR